MPPHGQDGLARRDFLKAALAIGGSAALTACVGREGEVAVASGPEDPDELSRAPVRVERVHSL